MMRRILFLSLSTAVPVACGTSARTDDVGEARAEIVQVPSDVRCVQMVVVGSGHSALRPTTAVKS